jgi:FAD/FMN-containing dehydrogenase
LFWAIRGAGSQSFGIVSKFTFRIYKAPKNVIIAKKFYPIKKFPEVFSLYQNLFASGLSNQIFLQLAIVNRQVTILLTGPSEISTKIREILDKFPPRPTKNTYNTLSFKDFLFQSALESYQRFADGALEKPSDLATLTRNVSLPNYSNDKSFFINRKLNPFEIIKLLELLLEMPEEGLVALEPFGGRINEVPVNATAFVHRSAYYSFKIRYQTVNLDPARLQRGNAWVKRTFHVTKIVLQHNETYQNYPDKDLTDYLDRYYGTNLPRLIQIKKKYDRSNYFRGPQTIPTKRK